MKILPPALIGENLFHTNSKFLRMRAGGEIGKKFLLANISTYMILCINKPTASIFTVKFSLDMYCSNRPGISCI